jgi:hypothetical protein
MRPCRTEAKKLHTVYIEGNLAILSLKEKQAGPLD